MSERAEAKAAERAAASQAAAQRETCRLINEMSYLRQEAHLTQAQLAKRMGTLGCALQTTEQKRNIPNLATFCLFLDALGYKLEITKKED